MRPPHRGTVCPRRSYETSSSCCAVGYATFRTCAQSSSVGHRDMRYAPGVSDISRSAGGSVLPSSSRGWQGVRPPTPRRSLVRPASSAAGGAPADSQTESCETLPASRQGLACRSVASVSLGEWRCLVSLGCWLTTPILSPDTFWLVPAAFTRPVRMAIHSSDKQEVF